jgi:hypothetical protein
MFVTLLIRDKTTYIRSNTITPVHINDFYKHEIFYTQLWYVPKAGEHFTIWNKVK